MAHVAVIAPVFIDTDLHRILAEQTLSSIQSVHTLTTIGVVNKIRDGSDDRQWTQQAFNKVIYNDRNCVARAWNLGIREAFTTAAEYAFVINLDLFLHPRCIDNLVAEAAHFDSEVVIWSGVEHPELESLLATDAVTNPSNEINTSAFMIDRRLPELVGWFDEQFEQAYHEDVDMLHRIRCAKLKIGVAPTGIFYHYRNGTILGYTVQIANPISRERLHDLDNVLAMNKERYIEKWGGPPNQEIFRRPYNKE